MRLARLIVDDLDELILRVEHVVPDRTVSSQIVDGIERLHADYAQIIRDDLLAEQSRKERPAGGP